jgi:GMP synthase (glutamine-hydrolysing)
MNRTDSLAIIDLGGQYAHLIVTKLRQLGYHAEIRDPEDDIDLLKSYGGIVLSGSPNLSAFDEEGDTLGQIISLDLPILGFCFGHQEINKHYGGKVIRGEEEFGPATLEITAKTPIFNDVPEKSTVFMSHGDTVSEIPQGFIEIGISYSEDGKHHNFAAIADEKRKRYGFQYHPEVDDSVYGELMLSNFANLVCQLKKTWNVSENIDSRMEKIREDVGDKTVFLLVSGGVDSTVLGELLIKALGPEKVHLLHIDMGFMRSEESKQVIDIFKNRIGDNFHFVDASEIFISALKGVVSPEIKRNIIGETFVTICEKEMSKLNLENALLAQGTIYPDTVESGGEKRGKVIKTHHNRVKLMEKMIEEGKVIEPLADLYKKEVRELGEKLELPAYLLLRHPFPGPGLAVRILGSLGELPSSFQETSNQNIEKFLPKGVSSTILPIPSVGVKADLRSYELPILLSDSSTDILDSEKQDLYFSLVPTLVKEIKGINRVLINLSGFSGVIKPQKAFLVKNRIELLQKADKYINGLLESMDLMGSVWQFPIVLVPLNLNGQESEMIVLRPVKTIRAMTATVPFLPVDFYKKAVEFLMELSGVGLVALDLTTKPPGTIEWE